jgi:hypothetical protein
MKAVLSQVKRIGLTGLNGKAIIAEKDIMECDGNHEYVCLDPRNHGLISLVLENNALAPQSRDKHFALTQSVGMNELRKLRNDAQMETLRSSTGCTLFGDEQEAPIKKKKRVSGRRVAMELMRRERTSIEVKVGGVAVRMLRPVHPNDSLCVEYTEQSITAVLTYVRNREFLASKPLQRDPSVPQGIQKWADHYQIVVKHSDGTRSFRKCKDLEAAIAEQAAISAGVGVSDGGDVACDEHVSDDSVLACDADIVGSSEPDNAGPS